MGTSLRIDRLSLGGEGVGRSNGMAVFVPYAAPGDEVEVELTDHHPRFARARLLRVIESSKDRINPPCPSHFRLPLAKYCGGCSWQHLSYEAQLRIKRDLVQEALERIGRLPGIQVRPTLGMKDPWRYRNKVQEPIGWDPSTRRLVSGFYVPNSHDIFPIEECLVQPGLSVRITNRVRELLQHYGARAYDPKSHTGWIRHLLVRLAGSQALLVFITRTPDFPHESEIVPKLLQEFPELVGIHQNSNPARTNVILGRVWRKIAGKDHLEERLGRLRFRISPASFFQVNSAQAEVLYDVVRDFAGRGERLLDLYAGVGTIALWLSENFKEVGGIEELPSAIRDADANAELNGIENVRFQAASAETFLRGLQPDRDHRLAVVLDPPRAGCTPGVLKALMALRPSPLVYVSCDPGTLARDLAVLARGGYRPQQIQPVDLFPHTPHIEAVVKLTG